MIAVGYVNVRGLSAAKWTAACRLLDDGLSYLFLAETWYVDHDLRRTDRRFVCCTERPVSTGSRGRPNGGICLLATKEARSRVERFVAGVDFLTFVVEGVSISGVYYPPQLPLEELSRSLQNVRRSAVILGDINTVFPSHKSAQGGGLPERIPIFQELQRCEGLRRALPLQDGDSCLTGLKLDHCFVRGARRCELRLLSSKKRGFSTDHSYIMHLVLPTSSGSVPPPPSPSSSSCFSSSSSSANPTATRFRLAGLTDDDTCALLLQTLEGSLSRMSFPHDCDEYNSRLLEVLCTCCHDVLRPVSASPPSARFASRRRVRILREPAVVADRLYREATLNSGENAAVVPTDGARARGQSAMDECLEALRERYASPPSARGMPAPYLATSSPEVEPFSRDDVVSVISKADVTRSADEDGLHVKILKRCASCVLFVDALQGLFNLCLRVGRVPRAWSLTRIHLLSKDPAGPRNIDNLRPITLMCSFRKLFEVLLCARLARHPCMELHPNQIGFRTGFAACTLAAGVHRLLAEGRRKICVCLDIKSAFDVLDLDRLRLRLVERNCPPYVLSLFHGLFFGGTGSTLLVNGASSEVFWRSRGVPQGAPSAPSLFNVYVDGLVALGNSRDELCFFYADDGILLGDDYDGMQRMLDDMAGWCADNDLRFGVAKCAVLTRLPPRPLLLYGSEIPRREEYAYLGFPLRADGIDFLEHVLRRLASAVGKVAWLGHSSGSWTVAERLRVYLDRLAPSFEYGAPLVVAWMNGGGRERVESFVRKTRAPWKQLLCWIGDGRGKSRPGVLASVLGQLTLRRRFELLHLRYQLVLDRLPPSFLRQLLGLPGGFGRHLGPSEEWTRFLETSSLLPSLEAALDRRVRALRRRWVIHEAREAHLTRLIPMEARGVEGAPFADGILDAHEAASQGNLLSYRTGVFLHGRRCLCGDLFRRGHEDDCMFLESMICLSEDEVESMALMAAMLDVEGGRFTRIDWMLNVGEVERAALVLEEIGRTIRLHFARLCEMQENEDVELRFVSI